jgi:hypothetical protein
MAGSKWLTFVAALLLLAPFTAEAIPTSALADTAKVELQWDRQERDGAQAGQVA